MNEDAYHFLFECTLYVDHRFMLYNTVLQISPLTTVALPAKNIKVINSFYKGMHYIQRCLML